MSLRDWLVSRRLVEHRATRQEITHLFAVASRDLADARTSGLSADWRLSIAYNAALQLAVAALAAAGYRAARESHHHWVVQSLAHTVRAPSERIMALDGLRKKRNVAEYEQAGRVSDQEAQEALELAGWLRTEVESWLASEHPDLLP